MQESRRSIPLYNAHGVVGWFALGRVGWMMCKNFKRSWNGCFAYYLPLPVNRWESEYEMLLVLKLVRRMMEIKARVSQISDVLSLWSQLVLVVVETKHLSFSLSLNLYLHFQMFSRRRWGRKLCCGWCQKFECVKYMWRWEAFISLPQNVSRVCVFFAFSRGESPTAE